MFLFSDIKKTFVINRLRSILSLLSIAIGAASLIAVISLSMGYSKELEKINFGKAARKIDVLENFYVNDRYGPPTLDDWKAIKDRYKRDIEASFLQQSGTYTAKWGHNNESGILQGVMGDYLFDGDISFFMGRSFSSREQNSPEMLCVIGYKVAQTLFKDTGPVGKNIRINKTQCKVLGVLASQSGRFEAINNMIYMPFWAFQRATLNKSKNIKAVDQLNFYVRSEKERARVIRDIEKTMRQRHGAPIAGITPFLIAENPFSNDNVDDQRQLTSLFMIFIGALSLIAGMLGVTNSMLASVSERKKEIGIRMAIGALPQDIRLQFLTEATLLSSIGVALGILLGGTLVYSVEIIYDWPFILDIRLIGLSVITGLVSGIISGFYPANKAAQTPPTEAIRGN